ncbi:MAG TPA: hypothetical protein VKV73_09690 [Chloroflexota bacterium]|nr:hypothetical protein [Chloroflexota bacterium]
MRQRDHAAIAGALLTLAVVGCRAPGQPPTTTEQFTALYRVTAGPFPLYSQIQDRTSPAHEPLLHTGCIFDVQRTSPDQRDASYVWGYGRVFRCDDVVTTGIVEPQMGIRPRELRVYDGSVGYFPMRLLEPYTGSPPAPR